MQSFQFYCFFFLSIFFFSSKHSKLIAIIKMKTRIIQPNSGSKIERKKKSCIHKICSRYEISQWLANRFVLSFVYIRSIWFFFFHSIACKTICCFFALLMVDNERTLNWCQRHPRDNRFSKKKSMISPLATSFFSIMKKLWAKPIDYRSNPNKNYFKCNASGYQFIIWFH